MSRFLTRVGDTLRLPRHGEELRQMRKELTATREELGVVRERLDTFAADIGHDLRNHLTSVSMSLEMLAAQPSVTADEDAVWIVHRALSGTRSLDQQITELDGAISQLRRLGAAVPRSRSLVEELGAERRDEAAAE